MIVLGNELPLVLNEYCILNYPVVRFCPVLDLKKSMLLIKICDSKHLTFVKLSAFILKSISALSQEKKRCHLELGNMNVMTCTHPCSVMLE